MLPGVYILRLQQFSVVSRTLSFTIFFRPCVDRLHLYHIFCRVIMSQCLHTIYLPLNALYLDTFVSIASVKLLNNPMFQDRLFMDGFPVSEEDSMVGN